MNNRQTVINNQPVVTDKKSQRKKVQRITFKPQLLLKSTGIEALYNKSKKLKLDSIDQAANLSKIIDTLKTWHFQIMPKYNYQYFLDRCRAFGATKLIQSYMTRVRKVHKGQGSWNNLSATEVSEHPQPNNRSLLQEQATSVFDNKSSYDYFPKAPNPILNRKSKGQSEDQQDIQLLKLMKQSVAKAAQQQQYPEQDYVQGELALQYNNLPDAFDEDD